MSESSTPVTKKIADVDKSTLNLGGVFEKSVLDEWKSTGNSSYRIWLKYFSGWKDLFRNYYESLSK